MKFGMLLALVLRAGIRLKAHQMLEDHSEEKSACKPKCREQFEYP